MAIIKSQGCVLQRETNDVLQVVGISGISSGAPAEIDVTDLTHDYRQMIMGIKDEGEIAVSLLFDPDSGDHLDLRTDRANGTLSTYQIILTDSSPTTLTFSAYVKTYDINIAQDDKVTLDVTLKLQGAIVYS